MNLPEQQSAPSNRLVLAETLDISVVNDLYSTLTENAKVSNYIEIDAGNVTRIDASALQLLYSWYASETNKGTKVVWKNAGGYFYQSARLLGLHTLLGIEQAK